MKNKNLYAFFSIAFLVMVFSSIHAAEDKGNELSETKVCRFAIPPFQKGRSFIEERKKYSPLLEWISQQTGCHFVGVGAKNYDDLINKMVTGKVMMAELGPVSYVVAKKRNPDISILAAQKRWNLDKSELLDYYHSYVISLQSNQNISTLNDLKGKAFGFVNKNSSSGFVFPLMWFKSHNINYQSFLAKHFYLGNHPNVAEAVVTGSIAAGAISEKGLHRARIKYGDIFNILWRSPPIPNILFASSSTMPPAMKVKLSHALVQLEVDQFGKAFVHRDDSFYDIVREFLD